MPDVQRAADLHYEDLYRFAWSLAGQEADARDLVQQTMMIYATHGDSLRDACKLKPWLFTTLHRAFLSQRRKLARFPSVPLDEFVEPAAEEQSAGADAVDTAKVMEALQSLAEPLRTPLTLFYLKDMKYREIAEIIGVPLGTVMSRLARAKAALRAQLGVEAFSPTPNAI